MPAYIIVRVDITDMKQYQQYLKAVPPIIERYGGKAITRVPAQVTQEGMEEKRRIVVLQFPIGEKAREIYHSPEYQKARKQLREEVAMGELVVVEGILEKHDKRGGNSCKSPNFEIVSGIIILRHFCSYLIVYYQKMTIHL